MTSRSFGCLPLLEVEFVEEEVDVVVGDCDSLIWMTVFSTMVAARDKTSSGDSCSLKLEDIPERKRIIIDLFLFG